MNQSNSDEIIFYVSKIYKDFCRIYEYLNSEFDSKKQINPITKVEKWKNLQQVVLYHAVLIDSGKEDRIVEVKADCLKLAAKYGYKGWKRFSTYYSAITNRKFLDGKMPFNQDDVVVVKKALEENFPENDLVIENLEVINRSEFK